MILLAVYLFLQAHNPVLRQSHELVRFEESPTVPVAAARS